MSKSYVHKAQFLYKLFTRYYYQYYLYVRVLKPTNLNVNGRLYTQKFCNHENSLLNVIHTGTNLKSSAFLLLISSFDVCSSQQKPVKFLAHLISENHERYPCYCVKVLSLQHIVSNFSICHYKFQHRVLYFTGNKKIYYESLRLD